MKNIRFLAILAQELDFCSRFQYNNNRKHLKFKTITEDQVDPIIDIIESFSKFNSCLRIRATGKGVKNDQFFELIQEPTILESFVDIMIAQINGFSVEAINDLIKNLKIHIPALKPITLTELQKPHPFASIEDKSSPDSVIIELKDLIFQLNKDAEAPWWTRGKYVVLGYQHALWLKEHQNEPEVKPLKKFLVKHVGFYNTVARKSTGAPYIPCLFYPSGNSDEIGIKWEWMATGL